MYVCVEKFDQLFFLILDDVSGIVINRMMKNGNKSNDKNKYLLDYFTLLSHIFIFFLTNYRAVNIYQNVILSLNVIKKIIKGYSHHDKT